MHGLAPGTRRISVALGLTHRIGNMPRSRGSNGRSGPDRELGICPMRQDVTLEHGEGTNYEEALMPRFLIERDLPGAGRLTPEELRSISQKSNEVLGAMAGRAQWLQSFVTDDKLYCVYIADDADTVAEHARIGGFPCTATQQVRTIIDPTTADIAV